MPASDDSPESEVRSLEDLIVTYDMKKLYAEAREEFESASTDRELLGQDSISAFFNLEERDDERN